MLRRRVVRRGLEPVPVLRRHAQHLGNHDDRQGKRQRFHEVEAALSLHGVQQVVADRLDARLQPGHGPGRERLGHQGAQAGVIRRVHVQHGYVVGIPEIPLVVGKAPMIAQHPVNVGIARQQPGVDQPHPMYGVPLAHVGVDGVGVGFEVRVRRVVGDARLQALPGEQRPHDRRPQQPFRGRKRRIFGPAAERRAGYLGTRGGGWWR